MKEIIRIVTSIILFVAALLTQNTNEIISTIFYLTSYIIIGYDVVINAIKNIFKGQIFDEHFLMALATVGAICIKEFDEAIAVMLLYQIGEMLQDYAVDKSKDSITELMDLKQEIATIKKDDKLIQLHPEEVKVNDILIVKPGEKIALDGIIIKGKSNLDTSMLTGEALPKSVKEQDTVLNGCINLDSVLEIKVTKEYKESTTSKILDLVENAVDKKSKSEKFITKFSKYYTPVVVLIAIIITIVPPLLIKDITFNECLYRALTFLVISCPCALVISIPLSLFCGIGAASRNGTLIKGTEYLEQLTNCNTIVFDKTGTLTKGNFKVTNINPIGITKDEFLYLAAHAESLSTHPIATSIKSEYNSEINSKQVTDIKELSGKGITCKINNDKIIIGNNKVLEEFNIKYDKINSHNTIVYMAKNNSYVGYLEIADEIKETSKIAIKNLKKLGIKELIMLTGDKKEVAAQVSKELGIDKYYSNLLPQDKFENMQKLVNNSQNKTVFVGDGINDAPVLTLSDIGISMGSIGSDAAIEASDIVIMNDDPNKISTSIVIANKTMKIVKQNIILAITAKIIILILSLIGIASMWLAVFADVGIAIIATVNATRALKIKHKEN